MVDDPMFVRGAVGGALIGLSAAMLFHSNGRIAGISGIMGGLLPWREDAEWRALFVGALVLGGALIRWFVPDMIGASVQPSLALVGVAGLLVGFGTRLGCGCTSGHGICGLARFSRRSLVAVLTFLFTGVLTVIVNRALTGDAV